MNWLKAIFGFVKQHPFATLWMLVLLANYALRQQK